MSTQLERARAFRKLHDGPGCFLMPNPWDRGSAKILAKMGFAALATTSAGHAFSHGLLDGGIARQEALDHIRWLSSATALPLSTDLEHGWGDGPEECHQVILDAAAHGAVGGSLEDTANGRPSGLYSLEAAAERIQAAAAAAESLPFPFTLTARAENFQLGVKRVSVGGCFTRAAYGELVRAAQTLRDGSSFGYADTALPGARLAEYLG